jgi:fatty acid desaturase
MRSIMADLLSQDIILAIEARQMQTYAHAKLTDQQGRALWLAMLDDVKRERLMAPSFSRTLLKLAMFFVLLGGALWLAWFQSSWPALAVAYVALSLLLAQFAFIGHDAGHGTLGRKAAVNRALGQISMTLVTGLAFDEWIGRHRTHHQFCQDEDRDPDMAVAFVVSLTEKSRRQKGVLGRFLTRYQAIHVWLFSLFFGHSQRHLSQAAVLANLKRNPLDGAVLLLHFALWFAVPCLLLDVPVLNALLAYVIPLTILGPYLAAIFWVNHIGMPLVEKVESFSFFEHQYVTSRTITNAPAWDWLFGGLNFQIEHHLFPQVPSIRLPAVQAIVRKHFGLHRIPYHGVPWWSAVRSIAAHLRRVAS